jgi:hypothetical protein
VPVIASLFSYDTTFCVVVQWSFVGMFSYREEGRSLGGGSGSLPRARPDAHVRPRVHQAVKQRAGYPAAA